MNDILVTPTYSENEFIFLNCFEVIVDNVKKVRTSSPKDVFVSSHLRFLSRLRKQTKVVKEYNDLVMKFASCSENSKKIIEAINMINFTYNNLERFYEVKKVSVFPPFIKINVNSIEEVFEYVIVKESLRTFLLSKEHDSFDKPYVDFILLNMVNKTKGSCETISEWVDEKAKQLLNSDNEKALGAFSDLHSKRKMEKGE